MMSVAVTKELYHNYNALESFCELDLIIKVEELEYISFQHAL